MTARTSVKNTPRFVGVITTSRELRSAARNKQPPDLFELRLDHFANIDMQIPRLPAPLIITARDPREGGVNKLSIKQRRGLLARFLDRAAYVDIELRNARALKAIVDLARRRRIGVILSFHDFDSTPSVRRLSAMASRAKSLGADVFKVATRSDTESELARLRDFAANVDVDLALAVMGIGKLAFRSRAGLPSALIYGAIKTSRLAGQPTLARLRASKRRKAE